MHRSAKWLGFVVVASLLAGACGGDDSASVDSPTTAMTTADTTADDGDRDRNGQVGGWGTNGSGVSTTKIAEKKWSYTRSSVFRRQRVETSGGTRVVFGTDVFVVSRMLNQIGPRTEVTMTVAGFDTSASEIAQYPIESLGDDGVVRISLADKGTDWYPVPDSWTVISRDLLAVFFQANSDESGMIGVVEYYNLATGELATNIGDDGRTTVPAGLGIDFVMELGLRNVDDDGTPHLTVVGPTIDGEVYTGIVVAGFTPDGQPDPAVGGPDGTITVGREAVEGAISWASLADPGLGVADGSRIGVVVELSVDPGDVGDSGAVEKNLTFLVMGVDADLQTLAYPGTRSFSSVYAAPQVGLTLRSVAFSASDTIRAHITTESPDASEPKEEILEIGRGGVDAGTAFFVWPDESDEGIYRYHIVDVAKQGKKFIVQVASSGDEQLGIVCFDVTGCNAPANRLTVPIGVKAEDIRFTMSQMIPDETGVRFVVGKAGRRTNQTRYSFASLDPSGANLTLAGADFDDVFDKYESNPETDATITATGHPLFIGSDTVVAMKNDYQPRTTTVLVKQKAGEDATVVTPSLPLGVERYVASTDLAARLGDGGVALAVNIVNSDTGVFERRLYRVSAENGSVDTSFGSNGYVQSPFPVEDDNCAQIDTLLGGSSSITSLIVDYDQISPDPTEGCGASAAEVTWQTFSATGTTIATPSRATLADLGEVVTVSWTADAQGNLFVLMRPMVTIAGDLRASELRVAKFTPAGKLDPAFGSAGIAVVRELVNSWRESVAVDGAGHVYVGGTTHDRVGNISLTIVRLSATGALDAVVEVSPTTTAQPVVEPRTPGPSSPAALSIERDERNAGGASAPNPTRDERVVAAADASATVIGASPVLSSVTTTEDRSLSVEWQLSVAVGRAMIVATAMPGGRACVSDRGSCMIRGLDPSETYTVSVALKDAPESATAMPTATSVAVKPVIVLKTGKIASPIALVRPASRGKATWKVRGRCTLNATNTHFTAPKSPTTCQLSVTTAKSGSTPKTTKSVTIVVKK